VTTEKLLDSGHAPFEIDAVTTKRIVESMVNRGDLSELTAEERSRFYVQICDSLGLSPATLPFAILRLNGKEVLYPTRAATDQLAAIHRLNREIVKGPEVITLGNIKMVMAVCRATHPNNRVETAIATVALSDPLNAMMKAETKAKRRATLSILGLGMLDEPDTESLPGTSRAQSSTADTKTQGGSKLTQEIMQAFKKDLAGTELPGECVSIWLKHRGEIATLLDSAKKDAWRLLCARTQTIGSMKNADGWLKRAIEEEQARAERQASYAPAMAPAVVLPAAPAPSIAPVPSAAPAPEPAAVSSPAPSQPDPVYVVDWLARIEASGVISLKDMAPALRSVKSVEVIAAYARRWTRLTETMTERTLADVCKFLQTMPVEVQAFDVWEDLGIAIEQRKHDLKVSPSSSGGGFA
jgi:hypothetical protein